MLLNSLSLEKNKQLNLYLLKKWMRMNEINDESFMKNYFSNEYWINITKLNGIQPCVKTSVR